MVALSDRAVVGDLSVRCGHLTSASQTLRGIRQYSFAEVAVGFPRDVHDCWWSI